MTNNKQEPTTIAGKAAHKSQKEEIKIIKNNIFY